MKILSLLLGVLLMSGMAIEAKAGTAVFAGGCFWCMHAEFEGTDGVSKVTSGYTGGTVKNPTYEQVSSGETGHVEAIEVQFDPAKISYEKLLDIFWSNVDPFDPSGQFCDKGSQYAAGIFTLDGEQEKLAAASKEKVEKKYGKKVASFIKPAAEFYAAEDYHQSYYKKNPVRYGMYKAGCGRKAQLEKLHGEME